MTAFTLIVSFSWFHNIPKVPSNGILSKSRLTDWQFGDKSSWGNFVYFFAYIYSFCLT